MQCLVHPNADVIPRRTPDNSYSVEGRGLVRDYNRPRCNCHQNTEGLGHHRPSLSATQASSQARLSESNAHPEGARDWFPFRTIKPHNTSFLHNSRAPRVAVLSCCGFGNAKPRLGALFPRLLERSFCAFFDQILLISHHNHAPRPGNTASTADLRVSA